MREVWYFCKLSSISFSLRRMWHRFGGYHLGCACGSWSDLSRVIDRDHFLSVYPDSCRECMRCLIVCCYCLYHMICLAVVEGHSDFAVFVFGILLVLPFVRFSLFAIGCVHHGIFHGGLTSCRIFRTGRWVKRWVKIRVKYRSKCCLLAWVHLYSLL
jgi:hypothetical protein